MSTIHFDHGKSFIEDFAGLIEIAKRRTPALIVVASDREVNTFEKYFREDLILQGHEDIRCMTFSDFYNEKIDPAWHVHAFRQDDIWSRLCGMATFEGATVKGRKRFEKEDLQ